MSCAEFDMFPFSKILDHVKPVCANSNDAEIKQVQVCILVKASDHLNYSSTRAWCIFLKGVTILDHEMERKSILGRVWVCCNAKR